MLNRSVQLDLGDSSGNVTGVVVGPTCCLGGCIECCKKIEYNVRDSNGNQVGSVSKVKRKRLSSSQKVNIRGSKLVGLDLLDSVPESETANILATTLLLDLVYLEGKPCECSFLSCKWRCCRFFCWGGLGHAECDCDCDCCFGC